MPITKEITSFINTVISDGSQQVGSEDDLIESGIIDSLAILQLVEFIIEKFNIDVDPDSITPENFSTVERISAFIRSRT